mmetsp:Transcript_21736/g.47398  ORF Transcript_21736/g.47398 Transcript_21736/m.47398 type:complete len:83 (-) Transcript_21736:530-778(-)
MNVEFLCDHIGKGYTNPVLEEASAGVGRCGLVLRILFSAATASLLHILMSSHFNMLPHHRSNIVHCAAHTCRSVDSAIFQEP